MAILNKKPKKKSKVFSIRLSGFPMKELSKQKNKSEYITKLIEFKRNDSLFRKD